MSGFRLDKTILSLDEKNIIIWLRWLIFLIMIFLALYGGDGASKYLPLILVFIALYFLTNVGLNFLPYNLFISNVTKTIIFCSDIAFVTFMIFLTVGFDSDFYVVYFLIIFMAGISQSVKGCILTTVVVNLIYIGMALKGGQKLYLLSPNFFLRLSFLYIISLFAHYFTEEIRKYRLRVEEMERLYRGVKGQLSKSAKLAALGSMMSGIVHEINGFLYIVLGNVEALLRNKNEYFKSKKPQKYLNSIFKSASKGGEMAKGLLGFIRGEKSHVSPIEINLVVEEILTLAGYPLSRDKINIVKNYSENLPMVLGDKDALQQAFLNIVINARDAMPSGGDLVVNTRVEDSNILVEFKDNGMGMTEEEKMFIFNPFYSTKEEGKGTGLGLPIAQDIILNHKGRIEVYSKKGEGTTFKIYFPQHKE